MASPVALKLTAAKQKSRIVANTRDPRAARTRSKLGAAFAGLLTRRSYSRIRVGDIARKAGVGRATFYAHYRSKDDLLDAELTRVLNRMLVESAGGIDCTAFFAHVLQAPSIYRSLTSGEAYVVTQRVMRQSLERQITRIGGNRSETAMQGAPYAARFIAATLLMLIDWSLEQPVERSPAALQEIFGRLVRRGLG